MTYTINDPIFGRFYEILIFKDEAEMLEFEAKNDVHFGVEDRVLDDISGNFFEKYKCSVITIPESFLLDFNAKHLAKLAKECLYCMFDSFEKLQIKLDLENQEIPAYYHEWLYVQALNTVFKHQKKLLKK
jgi:hypothetical protein